MVLERLKTATAKELLAIWSSRIDQKWDTLNDLQKSMNMAFLRSSERDDNNCKKLISSLKTYPQEIFSSNKLKISAFIMKFFHILLRSVKLENSKLLSQEPKVSHGTFENSPDNKSFVLVIIINYDRSSLLRIFHNGLKTIRVIDSLEFSR